MVPGQGTEDVFDGRDTRNARKACPSDLVRVARRKLDLLNQAAALGDLRAPPNNRLEKLKGDREGQYSIRINDQWRGGVLRAQSRGGAGTKGGRLCWGMGRVRNPPTAA